MRKIKPEVLNVLDGGISIKGNGLVIEEGLERGLYADVAKVLTGLGGKWNRKEQATLFAGDPTDMIDACILTGEYSSLKQGFQFFATPQELAKSLVGWAGVTEDHEVLEPSAGDGSIYNVLPGGCTVTMVELDDRHHTTLCQIANEGDIVRCPKDFMELDVESHCLFDRVVMNPPFTRNQDIKHIRRAFEMLKPGGVLVAVIGEGAFFREYRTEQEFRAWLDGLGAEVVKNDKGAFKSSGTMVNTRRIKVTKPK